jgi:hypothetical protein
LAGGDYNCKNTLWGSRPNTTKGRGLARVIQAHNFSFFSSGAPNYWPTDPNKIPDLDFFIASGISSAYTEVKPCYDLSSDHTPVIITIITTITSKRAAPRLHSTRTVWAVYKAVIREKLRDKLNLKRKEDIEAAITAFIGIFQQAAKLATPILKQTYTPYNPPSEIKRLIAIKRTVRTKWHKTHAPEDRRLFNNASNKLKTALHKLSNERFTTYITTLKRNDQSIWKPIKSRKRPRLQLPPIRRNDTPPGPWAQSDAGKVDLFARDLAEVFPRTTIHWTKILKTNLQPTPWTLKN